MARNGAATPIVIDTDPGIDDVVTLALAGRSPELDVVAVTTTYGNARLEVTTRNARLALEMVGRSDIPILPGADRPLVRSLVTAPETHGESGVGYATVTAASAVTPQPTALVTVLRDAPKPLTLVTIGPLTNLAHALETDADLVRRRILRHVGMFGNISERGNTNRWADFNTWSDPEAADRVLRARLPTVMVGLDVTRQMTLSRAEVAHLAESDDELTRWLGDALRFYVEFHNRQERLDGCVVNDVLTIGELVRPGLLILEERRLVVDLDEGDHRGHTREHVNGTATAVAMGVDIPRMRKLLGRVWGGGNRGKLQIAER